jgi:nitrogen fixation protein FixH
VIDVADRQEALGWSAEIQYAEGVLHCVLRDRNNKPLTPEKATVTFTRPTQEGMDFTVALKGEKTPINVPAKGLWDVRVDARVGDKSYQHTTRIVIK